MTPPLRDSSPTEADYELLLANSFAKMASLATQQAPAQDGSAREVEATTLKAAPLGTVIPPPPVRTIVEKTANGVNRNFSLLARIREKNDPRLGFVQPNHEYNAYFEWRLAEVKAGRPLVSASGQAEGQESGTTGVSGKGRAVRQGPPKPPDFQFSARRPIINAKDEDAIKISAKLVAANGKTWGIQLSQREAGNPEFDFMRPHHSLYQFYMRHAEQFETLMQGGPAQEKRIKDLEEMVSKARIQDDGTTSKGGKRKILERAQDRAEYAKHQEGQKVAKQEEEEKERIAYMEIDWHDFNIQDTITFDADDDEAELPPPTTKNDLQHQSLEQKAARRIDPNRRLEEAVPFEMEGVMPQAQQAYQPPQAPPMGPQPPQHQQQQQAPYMGPPGPQMPPQGPYGMPGPQMPPSFSPQPQQPFAPPGPQAFSPGPQQGFGPQPPQRQQQQWGQPPVDFGHTDESRAAQLAADRERARAAQMQARAPPPVNIRQNYVPAAQARQQRGNVPKSICPNCKQWINDADYDEHVKIELMDPRYNEQRKVAQARASSTNLYTQTASQNLKRWADARDGGQGSSISKEEEERRKRVELGSYDGVPNQQATGQQYVQQYGGQAPGHPQQQTDMQAQMARIYAKAGNQGPQQGGPPQGPQQ